MERYTSGNKEKIRSKIDDFIDQFHLSVENEDHSIRRYRIDETFVDDEIKNKSEQTLDLNESKDVERFFEGFERLEPEPVRRPLGESTVFTTAGVQRVESMLREHAEIAEKKFLVAQPVIRSQYMDAVKEGFSTSFVDVSIEHVNATMGDFFEIYKLLLALLINQGIPLRDIRVTISESTDQWGKKKVTKNTITFYVGQVEVSECVYIPDYSLDDGAKIAIADGCFGMERFCWGTGKHSFYYQDFDQFYTSDHDRNDISGVIDAVRTGVLIAREGVVPSHKDPGYRLRQCMTRFFLRNRLIKLDIEKLVSIAVDYWTKWSTESKLDKIALFEILRKEIERAHNVAFLSEFKKTVDLTSI